MKPLIILDFMRWRAQYSPTSAGHSSPATGQDCQLDQSFKELATSLLWIALLQKGFEAEETLFASKSSATFALRSELARLASMFRSPKLQVCIIPELRSGCCLLKQ